MEQIPDKVFVVFLDLGLLRLQKSLDHSEVPFGIHVIRILQYQLLLGVPEGLELLKDFFLLSYFKNIVFHEKSYY